MNELKDKMLQCKDCKTKFTFTIEEQKYFGQKGWQDPIRCRVCRRNKRIIRLRDKVGVEDAIKFSEICNKCGKQFYTKYKRKPNEKVYCDDCWVKIKGI